MIGDGVLNIADLQLVCSVPSGDTPEEALVDLKEKLSWLISKYCDHEYFSFTQFPDFTPGKPQCVKCKAVKDE